MVAEFLGKSLLSRVTNEKEAHLFDDFVIMELAALNVRLVVFNCIYMVSNKYLLKGLFSKKFLSYWVDLFIILAV